MPYFRCICAVFYCTPFFLFVSSRAPFLLDALLGLEGRLGGLLLCGQLVVLVGVCRILQLQELVADVEFLQDMVDGKHMGADARVPVPLPARAPA